MTHIVSEVALPENASCSDLRALEAHDHHGHLHLHLV
jgi:hypothetical protein